MFQSGQGFLEFIPHFSSSEKCQGPAFSSRFSEWLFLILIFKTGIWWEFFFSCLVNRKFRLYDICLQLPKLWICVAIDKLPNSPLKLLRPQFKIYNSPPFWTCIALDPVYGKSSCCGFKEIFSCNKKFPGRLA